MKKLVFVVKDTNVCFHVKKLGNALLDDPYAGLEGRRVFADVVIQGQLNFKRKNKKLVTYGDLLGFRNSLDDLFKGRLLTSAAVRFVEPDVMFMLLPKYHLKKEKGEAADCLSMQITDIYAEMVVNFRDGEGNLTGENHKIPLERQELEKIAAYLDGVLPKLRAQDAKPIRV